MSDTMDELREFVAQLEWRQLDDGRAYAGSIITVYFAHPDGNWMHRNGNPIGGGETLDDAKAAAQADYEQRIISALNPATVTALRDRIEVLEKERDAMRHKAISNAQERNAAESHLADARAEALEGAAKHVEEMFDDDGYPLLNRHRIASGIRALKSGGANG